MAAPGKANSKKKKSLKPPTEDASGPDKREQDQDQEEVASPWLAPENEDSDSDWGAVEEPDDLDDGTEKNRLFSELKTAWDNAPKSVRKRFVKKVLRLDLDAIDEEIWTS